MECWNEPRPNSSISVSGAAVRTLGSPERLVNRRVSSVFWPRRRFPVWRRNSDALVAGCSEVFHPLLRLFQRRATFPMEIARVWVEARDCIGETWWIGHGGHELMLR
jgi:hypothetical protein